MNNFIGFEGKWECPSCGNVLKVQEPFWNEKMRKQIKGPNKCGCGRKGSFSLMSFKPCQFKVEPEKKE